MKLKDLLKLISIISNDVNKTGKQNWSSLFKWTFKWIFILLFIAMFFCIIFQHISFH